MSAVIEVPASFEDRTFDQFASGLRAWPPEGRLIVDARQTTWSSPLGLVGLLTLGQAVQEAGGERPQFMVPNAENVRSYWARVGFFERALPYFEIHGRFPRSRSTLPSDVLLDLTPVRAVEDVHAVVDRIREQASHILTADLGLEASAAMGFSMTLSESCQNIVEHAGTGGWVAAQAYTFRRRLKGRRVLVIAVSDGGIGFRRSLEAIESKEHGDRWSDAVALESALVRYRSRFRDPGRGQGMKGIRRYMSRWDGGIYLRSGTARLAVVPEWDDMTPRAETLPFFPGAQLQLTIPGHRVVEGEG